MAITLEKYDQNLPNPTKKDTVYFIKKGQGFDLYASDTVGDNTYKLNGSAGSSFEPLTDKYAATDQYFYFGLAQNSTNKSVIQQHNRNTKVSKLFLGQPTNFTVDWSNHETLEYT